MKPLFIAMLLISALSVSAQNQKACCSAKGSESNAKFVALASDADFRSQHQEPRNTEMSAVQGEVVTFPAAGGDAHAFYLKPEGDTDKWLWVFHEWWGLNDQIKEEAQRLQKDLGNVHVLCLDLYDGKIATTRDAAGKLMQSADAERITAIITGAEQFIGDDAHIATIGWCFGGGWSLQAAIELGDNTEGCVMYYGMPEENAERLYQLNSDVLGIFASRDQWINAEVVSGFEETAKQAGVELTVQIFDADHAFANPTNSIYDEAATEQAYAMTLEYLSQRLME